MKKVLIISYYWPPAGGAGVQRWLKMSKYLGEFDVEPTILTVDPKYATYPVTDQSLVEEIPEDLPVFKTKSFEPLRYYGQIVGKKNVPYSGFANVKTESTVSKLSRWVRGNFFIPDARKGWNPYALIEARRLLRESKFDALITTGPPHSTHLVGSKLKSEFNLPWIADFRDPWTDIYYYEKLMHGSRAKYVDRKYELRVLENSDLVLSVCPSNQALLQSKLPEERRSKIVLLPNGFDESDFEQRNITSNKEFTMAYTGTMAANYNFIPLLRALSKLDFRWNWIIAGSISPEISQLLEEYGLMNNINYRGYVDHDEVLDIVASADLLLHVLPKDEKGTSGKLFEYIGSGKPILNMNRIDGDSAYYINEAGAGKTFTVDEVDQMIEFIHQVRSQTFKVKSRSSLFSRRAGAKSIANLISTI